jgi:nucleoside-triphosphatase THEP1
LRQIVIPVLCRSRIERMMCVSAAASPKGGSIHEPTGASRQPSSAMNIDTATDPSPPVAAIGYDASIDVDALLQSFVTQLRRDGRSVLGLLAARRDPATACRAPKVLTDVDTGDEYLVSQSLGAASAACSADPQGFARASRVLHHALERQPDLVVCNRFGALEAKNGGFAAELLALLERGVPVLTVVAPRHFGAWQRFIGEAPLLPPDPAAWRAWFDAVLRRSGAKGA